MRWARDVAPEADTLSTATGTGASRACRRAPDRPASASRRAWSCCCSARSTRSCQAALLRTTRVGRPPLGSSTASSEPSATAARSVFQIPSCDVLRFHDVRQGQAPGVRHVEQRDLRAIRRGEHPPGHAVAAAASVSVMTSDTTKSRSLKKRRNSQAPPPGSPAIESLDDLRRLGGPHGAHVQVVQVHGLRVHAEDPKPRGRVLEHATEIGPATDEHRHAPGSAVDSTTSGQSPARRPASPSTSNTSRVVASAPARTSVSVPSRTARPRAMSSTRSASRSTRSSDVRRGRSSYPRRAGRG